MINWKYTNEKRDTVVRINEDGSMESCIVAREDVQSWVAEGNIIEEPDVSAVEPPSIEEKVNALLKGGKDLENIKALVEAVEE